MRTAARVTARFTCDRRLASSHRISGLMDIARDKDSRKPAPKSGPSPLSLNSSSVRVTWDLRITAVLHTDFDHSAPIPAITYG